jgi:hypothetical protein
VRLPVVDVRGLLAVVPQMMGLLDQVEALIARIELTRQAAADQVALIDRTRREADAVIARIQALVGEAEPIVGTVQGLAPDVHEILSAVTGLTDALSHVPGLGRLKD